MGYQALYRKWRPKKFADIIGQEHIVTVLQNQVRAGHVSHAYLFCGARGTGKTSMAKIFARAVNCPENADGEPCNTCNICIQGGEEAVDIIEIDAASNNGVDEIRDLRDKVRLAPVLGRYKVYIIDEVHMLSTGAFNALLKTLEEPPAHVLFILATTEPHKLPATVLSRCQRYDFWRLPPPDIEKLLKEVAKDAGADIDESGLREIARAADGGMRDALSMLEQCISIGNGKIKHTDVLMMLGAVDSSALYALTGYLLESNAGQALTKLSEIIIKGKDISSLNKDLIRHFRDLLVTATCGASAPGVYGNESEMLKKQAELAPAEKLIRCIDILSDCESDMRASTQPRMMLEAALVKICLAPAGDGFMALSERISALETMARNGSLNTSRENKNPAKEKAEKASDSSNKNADSDTSEETAEGIFKNLLAYVRKHDISLYSLLKDGTPTALEDNVLKVAFDESSQIMEKMLRLPENREAVARSLHSVAGRDMIAQFFVQKKETAGHSHEDIIRNAMNFFGEENVKIK